MKSTQSGKCWKVECWHCDDATLCECFLCGHYTSGSVWVAGKCLACKGRKENAELFSRPEMADVDPREHKHWRHEKTITGGSHRVFEPQLKEGE